MSLVILFGVATLALALSFGRALSFGLGLSFDLALSFGLGLSFGRALSFGRSAIGLPARQVIGAIGAGVVTSAFLPLLIVGLDVDRYTSSCWWRC